MHGAVNDTSGVQLKQAAIAVPYGFCGAPWLVPLAPGTGDSRLQWIGAYLRALGMSLLESSLSNNDSTLAWGRLGARWHVYRDAHSKRPIIMLKENRTLRYFPPPKHTYRVCTVRALHVILPLKCTRCTAVHYLCY